MQKDDGHSAERSKVKQCLLPAPDFSLEKLAKSSRDRLFFAHICHRRTLPRSGRRVTLSFISGLTTTRCIAEETMKVALDWFQRDCLLFRSILWHRTATPFLVMYIFIGGGIVLWLILICYNITVLYIMDCLPELLCFVMFLGMWCLAFFDCCFC